MLDPQVKVELTATERTGMQRYTFPKDSSNRIMIQLNIPAEYAYDLKDAVITKNTDTEICGYARTSSANFNDYCLYFVMQFSKPFHEFHGYGNRSAISNDYEIKGNGELGAYVTYPTSKTEQVIIRTGISFVSMDQARFNLRSELKDFNWKMYQKTGWLSKGPAGIEYSGIMEGSHEMALIASAYLKGIMKKDADIAYAAMKKNMEIEPQPVCGGNPGNPLITEYTKLGFVPVEKGATSKTLDYAYDDWCVAQMAKLLHKNEYYNFFLKRSGNWKNVFDPASNYVTPKKQDGSFIPNFDLFSVNHFVEGNSWQYSLYVPHDVPGLINLIHQDAFLKRLTTGFKRSESHKFAAHALDRTMGLSAEYYINQGNEVNMQAAYLFNYAGAHLTQ